MHRYECTGSVAELDRQRAPNSGIRMMFGWLATVKSIMKAPIQAHGSARSGGRRSSHYEVELLQAGQVDLADHPDWPSAPL